jgi:subtilase family serine protease
MSLRRPLSVECLEDRAVPSSARVGGGVTNPNPVGLTPAQVRHAYGFDQIPAIAGNYNAVGQGQTIAIVMGGDQPNIASDLHVFDTKFNLPDPTFVKLNQAGSATGPWPAVNASWAGEISLDVEWAHAIAPAATIVLVEANSSNVTDLLAAIDTARNYPGVSVVSMSWGLLEGSVERGYDAHLTTPPGHTPVTFVAATLDNGSSFPKGTYWPAASPNVIGVGGTTLTLAADGSYAGETAWAASTGGLSPYEPQPAYQAGFVAQSGTKRGIPDVAYHADNTGGHGFAVYDTVPLNRQTGWFNAYGDSAGTPQWGALVAIADQQRAEAGLPTLDGPTQTLPGLYGLAAQSYATYFHDVTTGGNRAYKATAGYDLVTGLGTPRTAALVAGLAGLSSDGTPAPLALPPESGSPSGSAITGGGVEPAGTMVQLFAPPDDDTGAGRRHRR